MAEFKNFARLGRRCATHYAPLSRSVKGKLISEHLDRERNYLIGTRRAQMLGSL